MTKWLPALALATQLHANTIDIGPSGITSDRVVDYNNLNGTQLTGQALSFDVMFNNSVHVFTTRYVDFEVGLWLQLANSQFVTGSAYLLDANYNLVSLGEFGSSRSDSGLAAFGLFPTNQAPFDFYGIHFDLNMPANDSVLSGQLFFIGQHQFRIGAHVADSGTTIILLACGLIGLLLYDSKATR